jgi:hypothetical protein
MDVVLPSIWISSLAGAFCFYAGGRLRSAPTEAPFEAPRADLPSPELEAERENRKRAEEDAAGAWRAHREAVAAVAEERGRAAAAREELAREREGRAREAAEAGRERQALVDESAKLGAHAQDLAQELAVLRSKQGGEGAEVLRRAHAAETRAAAAERRAGELTALIQSARAEGEKARAGSGKATAELTLAKSEQQKLAATLQRITSEAAGLRTRAASADAEAAEAKKQAVLLRAENTRLERTVEGLRKARTQTLGGPEPLAQSDLADVQKKSMEAAMQLRLLEQRGEEIARREAENAELRRKVEALGATAAEVEQLRQRVRDLEALGFARRPLDSIHELDDVPDSKGRFELESSLELGLRDLVKREVGCRAAVLADGRGLLIAAYGESGHRVELAAAASLTTTTADRLRDLLPLGMPTSVSMVDDNAIEVRTRWLRWDDECFLLCTLGVAAEEDGAAAEALRFSVSEAIGVT